MLSGHGPESVLQLPVSWLIHGRLGGEPTARFSSKGRIVHSIPSPNGWLAPTRIHPVKRRLHSRSVVETPAQPIWLTLPRSELRS